MKALKEFIRSLWEKLRLGKKLEALFMDMNKV